MAFSSDPQFRVHHALRIKGFAKVDHLSPLAGLPEDEVTSHLEFMKASGLTHFREVRALWQLTPAGREAHTSVLIIDIGRPGFREGIAKPYPDFLTLNEAFKALCGDWQLRDGAPNDHSNVGYDRAVVERLTALNKNAEEITREFGRVAERFVGYVDRLNECQREVVGGAHNMFTGVMCGSYHDVWMELHEDLILSQGISRSAEGSF